MYVTEVDNLKNNIIEKFLLMQGQKKTNNFLNVAFNFILLVTRKIASGLNLQNPRSMYIAPINGAHI